MCDTKMAAQASHSHFFMVFFRVTHDGLSERGTTRSLVLRMLSRNFLNWIQASPVEDQSLQQKDKKRRKRKGAKKFKKIEKPIKDLGHCRIQKFSMISAHAQAKMS